DEREQCGHIAHRRESLAPGESRGFAVWGGRSRMCHWDRFSAKAISLSNEHLPQVNSVIAEELGCWTRVPSSSRARRARTRATGSCFSKVDVHQKRTQINAAPRGHPRR